MSSNHYLCYVVYNYQRVVSTALHWMQGGLVARKVSSVPQTRGFWQNRKICPDFYTIRKII